MTRYTARDVQNSATAYKGTLWHAGNNALLADTLRVGQPYGAGTAWYLYSHGARTGAIYGNVWLGMTCREACHTLSAMRAAIHMTANDFSMGE